jgi:uncharacterized protein (DUF302 family)
MEALKVRLQADIEKTEQLVRELLAENGFGVLTEIDVAKTLKEKLNVTRSPMKILGACNPALANQALGVAPEVALLLPCNVVLEQQDDETQVSIVDPREIMPFDSLKDIANEAYQRLEKVKKALALSVGY